MRRWGLGLSAAGVLLVILAMSGAQERGRPEPGFGGPGPGFGPGPGGPGPGGPGFGGPGFRDPGGMLFVGMPEVQKELKLDEGQTAKVQQWLDQAREELRKQAEATNFESLFQLAPEERERSMDDLRRRGEAALEKTEPDLQKALSSSQWERLTQLRRQRDGLRALQRDDVAKVLNLTPEQRDKLGELARADRGFGPPNERSQRDQAGLAVLTDAQRETWKSQLGTPFTFPEPMGFGPGGPGQERALVKQFDRDEDGRLNREERVAAREFLKTQPARGPGGPGRGGFGPPFGGPGGPGGRPGGPGGPGFPGGPGGFGGGEREQPRPGAQRTPADVKSYPDAGLYEPGIVRTLFLQFEEAGWEAELADFNNTDVEVPATVTVDGKAYPNVGVHFRGMSSFMMVPAGSKRSLNLAFDFVDEDQRLYGYKTLNLLNSHEDPTFLHTVLYLDVARKHIPAPKANFVRVVINGEDWGIYVNTQQFNKEFLTDNSLGAKSARWKVQGSPGGRGGLEYLGEDIAAYKSRYAIKSKDSTKDWKALIQLCKTLNETPLDQLEAALEPILDVDGALWFLALENALINSDGYWIRASDYCIVRDTSGKFHIIPHDANETFQPGGGPGMRGGPGGPGGGFGGRGPEGRGPEGRGPEGRGPEGRGPEGRGPEGRGPEGRGPEGRGPEGRGPEGRGPEGRGPEGRGPEGRGPEGRGPEGRGPEGRGPEGRGPEGRGPQGGGFGPGRGSVDLDPLIGLNDTSKPLRSRLLAVPSLRARYLAHVRTIAQEDLDWNRLKPQVDKYVALLDAEIKTDPKKLSSYEAFRQGIAGQAPEGGRGRMSLKAFADQRRQFLLNHAEIKALPKE